jgi:transcription-repair coupling factor (superfamily II helicase)
VDFKNNLNSFLENLDLLNPLLQAVEQNQTVQTKSLIGSLKTFAAIKIFQEGYSVFLPFEDFTSAKRLKAELELIGYEDSSILLLSEKLDLYTPTIEEVLQILSNKNNIVVTTFSSLFQPILTREEFQKNNIALTPHNNVRYDDLIDRLESLNYQRQNFVESRGDYAVRGSVVDIFSFCHSSPIRLEYDGDQIHSMRLFDPDNQRSFSVVENYSIYSNEEEKSNSAKSTILDFAENSLVILNKSDFTNYPNEQFSTSSKLVIENEFLSEGLIQIEAKSLPQVKSNLELLQREINKLISENYRVYIFAEQQSHADRLRDLIYDYSENFQTLIDEGKVRITIFPLREGFIDVRSQTAYFTEHQIFNRPFYITTKYTKKLKGVPKHLLNTIKKGDYVVHTDYGVGRFEGLEKIKVKETPHEVMKIAYAEKDVVYVNINFLNKVKKYSSKDSTEPTLSKLGSSEWKTTKARIKSKIQAAVRDLIKLYASRKSAQGFKFTDDTVWQKELEASFYYEDTPDQIKVTDEIKKDMQSAAPMERLVCGDVGFGKTEVAVRAAFKSVMDSKQVAILVPTTILAEQHYNTFLDRLSKYPIQVCALSRFVKKSKQNEILAKLERGEIDVIIGTHRLLSSDIRFKDLGLLIIDEEHRFGVMAKEKIRQVKANVDTIYLTATPIPRTLNMALAGSKDISIIATPPPNRLPIVTDISKFDIDKIREVILFELGRSGQIFFVHDRVGSIEKMTGYLQKNIKEAKFCIAHGQMKSSKLESVLHDFLNKKFDVLVCTKIIGSGLDIPNANTIIINRAEQFGLSELYQLRGRVGRTNKQAYAFLFVPSLNTITRDAVQRIQALEEFSEIGSGFNLSMRDLEIRGAGNLLGTEQSGFIQSVGFEMYMKILEEAVTELKEKEFSELFNISEQDLSEKIQTTLDVDFDYNIPVEYIEFQDERLYYYTKLFTIKELSELNNIQFEIQDKYGDLPENVQNLIELAKLRFLGSKACFEKIEITEKTASLNFPSNGATWYYDKYFPQVLNFLNLNYSREVKIEEKNRNLKLRLLINFGSYREAVNFLKNFFEEIKIELGKINNSSISQTHLSTLQIS